jgi:GMP synthase (glutamine-hydrolysing)
MEKRIIIIQHKDNEGPGLIADSLMDAKWPLETVSLGKGDRLPQALDDIAAVICLGGPMNVYEEDDYPYLKEEDRLIVKILIEEIPFLGICLGSQLLAKACGAPVSKAPQREVGWYRVDVTAEGQRDRLFKDLSNQLTVFQWHEDTFEVPEGATLLATGHLCANQAFRIGNYAYGLQFHIEVTEDMVDEWMESEKGEIAGKDIRPFSRGGGQDFEREARQLLLNFKMLIESSLRIRRVIKLFVEDEERKKRKRPIFWWVKEETSLAVALNG